MYTDKRNTWFHDYAFSFLQWGKALRVTGGFFFWEKEIPRVLTEGFFLGAFIMRYKSKFLRERFYALSSLVWTTSMDQRFHPEE